MILIMSCTCNQNLEDTDLMSELPCCGLVMHSKCAFKLIADGSYHGVTVLCPGCESTIWSHPLYSPSTQVIPEGCLDELKTLKPVVTQYRRSLLAFRKKVVQSKQDFKTLIAPYIEQIKAAKKAAKDAIKGSDEYKIYAKAQRSYAKHMSALATKYDIPLRLVNQHYKILWWRSNPMRYINGFLYVRV